MKLPFGFLVAREKSIQQTVEQAVAKALARPGGSWSIIHDFQVGAFEQGLPPLTDSQMTQQACVYACVTLIANSIAKLPLNQIQLKDGVWQKVETTYELLNRPSLIANRITWVSYAVACMLTHGAVFGLKRFERGRVRYIELLHPSTEVLVSEMGEVFYRLNQNIYSHMPEAQRTVPARFIFHVPYNTLVHPLIGVPPLEAARAAALAGSAIMAKQARTHASKPEIHGFLKMPVTITDAQAAAAKEAWKQSTADGAGIAVLRNGVEFHPLQLTAQQAESAAALNLANEDIARAFGVPKHLLGIGTIPSAANAEALMLGFYSQTLQPIAELLELGLDEALELPSDVGVEFDVTALSRLDTKGRLEAHQIALNSGLRAINEARADEGWAPVPGGDKPRVQMQDVPLDEVPNEPEPQEDEEDDEVLREQVFSLTKSVGSLEATASALQASLSRINDDVSDAVAASVAEIKSFAEGLAEQFQRHCEEQSKVREDLEQRIKAADDLLLETQEAHKKELEAIRKSVEDRSEVEKLVEAVKSLSQTVTVDRERLEKSIESLKSEIAERDERIESLSKALADAQKERERVDGRVEELAGLVQKAGNSAELESIAEKLSSLESSLSESLAQLNERVVGCMKFAGQWDEGEKYETGATVAYKNSLWVAMRDNPGSPGTSDSGWKMCIKSGKLITPYEHR